jgi:hypothetical protein
LGIAWDDFDQATGELNVAWQLQRVGRELLRRETKTEEAAPKQNDRGTAVLRCCTA